MATLAALSRHQGCDRFFEPLRWHMFHPRLVGHTRARTQRTKWLGDGTRVHVLLAFCRPRRRELFWPTRPRQPSRHASSAGSCEGRAGRGWLPLGAWRERSGRQTATCLAPPPLSTRPPTFFPLRSRAPQTADGDVVAGNRRPGLGAAPRGPPPARCPGGGVWSGRRGAACPCALAGCFRGAQWRPASTTWCKCLWWTVP